MRKGVSERAAGFRSVDGVLFYIIEFEKLATLQEVWRHGTKVGEKEELKCAFGILGLQVMVADTGDDEICQGNGWRGNRRRRGAKRRRQKTIAACVVIEAITEQAVCIHSP